MEVTWASASRRRVGGRGQAAFGHHMDMPGQWWAPTRGRDMQVGDEGLEVAVVDADHVGDRDSGPGPVLRRHAPRPVRPCPSAPASSSRARASSSAQYRHDDQDAVGAPAARLDHLVGRQHEILAQHRQSAPFRAPRRDIPAPPGRRACPSGRKGRRPRLPHRLPPARADRTRRGSVPWRGWPS